MSTVLDATGLLLALGIIGIGSGYLAKPFAMIGSFGLPLPETANTLTGWLRLKGVRDIVSGLLVIALMVWATRHDVGLVLLIAALIPTGDMLVILAARGSRSAAFGIHGLTAAIMVVTGSLVLTGGN